MNSTEFAWAGLLVEKTHSAIWRRVLLPFPQMYLPRSSTRERNCVEKQHVRAQIMSCSPMTAEDPGSELAWAYKAGWRSKSSGELSERGAHSGRQEHLPAPAAGVLCLQPPSAPGLSGARAALPAHGASSALADELFQSRSGRAASRRCYPALSGSPSPTWLMPLWPQSCPSMRAWRRLL